MKLYFVVNLFEANDKVYMTTEAAGDGQTKSKVGLQWAYESIR